MNEGRKPYGPPYETRVEPDLGVPVLTHTGYLAREADRRGTTVEDEMEDEAGAFAEINEEFLSGFRDPANVWATVQEFVDIFNREERAHFEQWRAKYGSDPPATGKPLYMARPRRILGILSVEGGLSWTGHKVEVRALAIREHGRRDVLCLMDSYSRGRSYYEQPESDQDVWWESEQKEIGDV